MNERADKGVRAKWLIASLIAFAVYEAILAVAAQRLLKKDREGR